MNPLKWESNYLSISNNTVKLKVHVVYYRYVPHIVERDLLMQCPL